MTDNPYRYMPEPELLKMYRSNLKKADRLSKAGYGGRSHALLQSARVMALELDRRGDERERR